MRDPRLHYPTLGGVMGYLGEPRPLQCAPVVFAPQAADLVFVQGIARTVEVEVVRPPEDEGNTDLDVTLTGALPAGLVWREQSVAPRYSITGRPGPGTTVGNYPLTVSAQGEGGVTTVAFTLVLQVNPNPLALLLAGRLVGPGAPSGLDLDRALLMSLPVMDMGSLAGPNAASALGLGAVATRTIAGILDMGDLAGPNAPSGLGLSVEDTS